MDANTKPTFYEHEAREAFRRSLRIQPDRIRRTKVSLCQLLEPVDQALSRLDPVDHEAAREWFDWEPLRVVEARESSLDRSVKMVLECRDGARIETVLIQAETPRTSVCVSTQVGCRAGCTFCATARMGLLRNLTASEITEQIRLAGQRSLQGNRRLRNVVFMGMGEPLHNEQNLYQAIDWLLDPQLFALPHRKVTVSTVGIPDAMRRLVERYPGIQIALSLHSAKPDLRAKLVPWTRQTDWQELRETVQWIAKQPRMHRHQGPIMIEYIMIQGVNDSLDDAQALLDYLDGAFCIINLIPYNAISFAPNWQPTLRPDRERFANYLRDAGIFTTIRYSMGSDVQAACGQLVQSTHAS
jgi:23S rRNA (adenine2503-C2)-methyltransferase